MPDAIDPPPRRGRAGLAQAVRPHMQKGSHLTVLPDPAPRDPIGRMMRIGWLALGVLCVALGIVGALLPLMPTTIFLIGAAACFARSSPRLEAWLLGHPRFGPTLRAWRSDGAIGPGAKRMACGGIAAGYGLFLFMARPPIGIALIVALPMALSALYIARRPTIPR